MLHRSDNDVEVLRHHRRDAMAPSSIAARLGFPRRRDPQHGAVRPGDLDDGLQPRQPVRHAPNLVGQLAHLARDRLRALVEQHDGFDGRDRVAVEAHAALSLG
jgi:hypothetical protein